MGTCAKRLDFLIVVALFGTIYGCSRTPDSKNAALSLIVTSIDNPYFVEMADSAKAAAAAAPVATLDVLAPERGAVDAERQLQLIESTVSKHVAAILVVPADSVQVLPAIKTANAANIPVLVLDNDVDHSQAERQGIKIAAFIGSDNVAGGKLAGDFVKQKLGDGGGEVVILEGVTGVQAATDRKGGFVQVVGNDPKIKIVASQAADWDREKAYNITRAILVAHPDVKAIFAANDEMALGAAKALVAIGRKDVVLVGYDATPDGRDAVRAGSLAATVAQQPGEVGRTGVEYAKKILNGDSVPPRTTIPLKLITR